MSCAEFEERVALYVEGDLDRREARRVREHLEECPACRVLAAGLAGSQAALKSLREEAVDRPALAEVRWRVLDRIGPGKPSIRYALRWKHALAGGLAVVAAMAVALSPRYKAPLPPPAPAATARAPANAVVVARKAPLAPRTTAKTTAAPIVIPPATFGPPPIEPLRIEPVRIDPPASSNLLVVKLVSDDPEVVIVWLIDQNGDGT